MTLTGTDLDGVTAVQFGTVLAAAEVQESKFINEHWTKVYQPNFNVVDNPDGTETLTVTADPAQTAPGPVEVQVLTPGGWSNPKGTYIVAGGLKSPKTAADIAPKMSPDQCQFTYTAKPVVSSLSFRPAR